MADVPLSAEPEAEARRLFELFRQPVLPEARRLARLFAGKATPRLLGEAEFEPRDAVHDLGAALLQTALGEREKGGTRAPA